MTNYEYRTVMVDLDLKPKEIDRLQKAVSSYKKAFQAVIEWSIENKTTSLKRAHEETYRKLRDEIAPDLPAVQVQSATKHALAMMKSYNSNNKTKKYEKELVLRSSMMKFNTLGVELNTDGRFSFAMDSDGRVKTRIRINRYFDDKYGNEWKFATAEVGFNRKGKPIAMLIYRHELPKLREEGKIVGIDRGIYNPVYTSEGENYSSKKIRAEIRKREYNRKRTQAKVEASGSRSARRARKRQQRKAFRLSLDTIHKMTKKLAEDEAVKTYVLEDLTGLYQKKSSKPFNRLKLIWAPAKFAEFLEYKCASNGIEVVYVDPAYTSQRCSECGFVNQDNRNSAVFRCLECGHCEHADFNASKNIRDLYLSPHARFEPTECGRVCQSPNEVPRKGGQATTLE